MNIWICNNSRPVIIVQIYTRFGAMDPKMSVGQGPLRPFGVFDIWSVLCASLGTGLFWRIKYEVAELGSMRLLDMGTFYPAQILP